MWALDRVTEPGHAPSLLPPPRPPAISTRPAKALPRQRSLHGFPPTVAPGNRRELTRHGRNYGWETVDDGYSVLLAPCTDPQFWWVLAPAAARLSQR